MTTRDTYDKIKCANKLCLNELALDDDIFFHSYMQI